MSNLKAWWQHDPLSIPYMRHTAVDWCLADRGMADMRTIHPETDIKSLRSFGETVIPKIVKAATIEGFGHDLLTHIYLTGLYHGVTIEREKKLGQQHV